MIFMAINNNLNSSSENAPTTEESAVLKAKEQKENVTKGTRKSLKELMDELSKGLKGLISLFKDFDVAKLQKILNFSNDVNEKISHPKLYFGKSDKIDFKGFKGDKTVHYIYNVLGIQDDGNVELQASDLIQNLKNKGKKFTSVDSKNSDFSSMQVGDIVKFKDNTVGIVSSVQSPIAINLIENDKVKKVSIDKSKIVGFYSLGASIEDNDEQKEKST